MSAPTCDDGTMRTLVGFLVLGRLSEVEHRTVTRHLETCARCRAERAEIDRVVSVLGLLSVADVRALVADFGAEMPVAGPVADQLFGAPGAPRVLPGARPAPASATTLCTAPATPGARPSSPVAPPAATAAAPQHF